MKKTKPITYVTTTLLVLSFCLMFLTICFVGNTLTIDAYASADSVEYTPRDVDVEEENIVDFCNAMDILENELEENNTTVLEQLNKQLTRYTDMLNNETYRDLDNIKSLIATTENLIEEYQKYANRNISRAPYHWKYTPIVSAAIAYFNIKDYILSAELLTHAKANNTSGSLYKVEHTNVIESSDLFREIASGDVLRGSATFNSMESIIEADLRYSIHAFDFEKESYNSHGVRIIDVYDFSTDNPDFSETDNKAIKQIYDAQAAGAIIPFRIREFCTSFDIVDMDSSYNIYTEHCDLYNSEIRQIWFNVKDYTHMNIKITGSSQVIGIGVTCVGWDETKKQLAKTIDYDVEIPSSNEYYTPSVVMLIQNTIIIQSNSIFIQVTFS